jgi:hypothetical protein
MIAQGALKIGGDERYACPAQACGASPDAAKDRAATEALRERVARAWPSTPPSSIVPSREDMGTALCRSRGDTPLQGLGPESDQCELEIFDQPRNPWDTYAACMVEATGTGNPPEVFEQLPGVPMGQRCGLYDDGGADTPEPPKDEPPAAADNVAAGDSDGDRSWWDDVVDFFSNLFSGDDEEDGKVSLTVHNDGKVSIDVKAKTKAGADKAAEKILRMYTDPNPTVVGRDAEGREISVRLGADAIFDVLEKIHEGKQKLPQGDCVDPESCPNACTGLGAQVAAVNKCTDDLLDAFRDALGRPRRGPDPTQPGRPRGIVSNWDPEHAPVDEGKPDACVPGDTGPTRTSPSCGLILCPGLGLAADAPGGACQCGSDPTPIKPLVSGMCYLINCGPDQILTEDCRCQPADRSPIPPGGPGPLPTRPDRSRRGATPIR